MDPGEKTQQVWDNNNKGDVIANDTDARMDVITIVLIGVGAEAAICANSSFVNRGPMNYSDCHIWARTKSYLSGGHDNDFSCFSPRGTGQLPQLTRGEGDNCWIHWQRGSAKKCYF